MSGPLLLDAPPYENTQGDTAAGADRNATLCDIILHVVNTEQYEISSKAISLLIQVRSASV